MWEGTVIQSAIELNEIFEEDITGGDAFQVNLLPYDSEFLWGEVYGVTTGKAYFESSTGVKDIRNLVDNEIITNLTIDLNQNPLSYEGLAYIEIDEISFYDNQTGVWDWSNQFQNTSNFKLYFNIFIWYI